MIRTSDGPALRRRSIRPALAGLAAIVTLVLMGCAGGTADETVPVPAITRPTSSSTTNGQTPDSPEVTASGPEDEPAPDPIADPIAVQAPDVGIDTGLIPVGLDDDGAMDLPDPGTGAWYELGPRPGEPGPAVLIGHVDSDTGPDVFYGLSSLAKGDTIVVDDAGDGRHMFIVESIEVVEKDTLPYERIWADSSDPLLRLITCGGEYDPGNGGYQHNVVVYAAHEDNP
jgi:hypothetical protein